MAHARGAGHGAAPARVVCVSPYDLPGCSPLTHVTPGVLPAPAPEVTPAGGEPPPVGGTAAAGPALPPEPLARAPDLHVLQVLRT
uniref:Uncharacterized protein n=1 Tax=Streptomyces sp. NBC_00049 TaxID=2903617 RepID=A0AAU2JMZ3_9ACTN